MSKLEKAARQALEAIDYLDDHPEGGIDEAEAAIEALRAALAQPEPFNPDWDRVEALEASLREHMAEIHRLKALAGPNESFCDLHCTWHVHHPDCVLGHLEKAHGIE